MAEVLDGLENQLIVKHEIVSDKLTKTVYEDGSTVYVNFGESPVQCEGVEIAARGFAVRKGSD